MADVSSGTTGRYEVLSRIAAGGMGEVYRARMSSGGGASKQVALKVVRDALADDAQYAEMLIAEAKVAMSLSHANVVQAFDAGRLGPRFFLAMELVDGATVRDLLRRAGPLPTAQAVTIAVEALKGLDYAHRFVDPDSREPLDIVHRDVSPSNLLVSREGEVKVADFGIALSAHTEEDGSIKGKVAYMAPEQLRGEALDRRTDVYALGVVLYEMLTGQRPFGRGAEAALRVESGEHEPPRAHVPDLDEELERVVERAMQRRAADRFPSAAAMRQELERWALERKVLLSTADLADYLLDLEDHEEDERPSLAPTLADGTVLQRQQTDGVSMLLPADLGARLAAAVEVETAVTANAKRPPPAAKPAGRGWMAVLALVAVMLGGGLGIWAFSSAEPAPETAPATAPAPASAPAPAPAPASAPAPAPAPETAPETASAPEPAPRRRATPRTEPAPPSGAPARVSIASDPWALVTMDGRSLGRTTLMNREVPPGRHTFVLRNQAAGLEHTFTATLAPGETRRFSIDLHDP